MSWNVIPSICPKQLSHVSSALGSRICAADAVFRVAVRLRVARRLVRVTSEFFQFVSQFRVFMIHPEIVISVVLISSGRPVRQLNGSKKCFDGHFVRRVGYQRRSIETEIP